MWIDSEFDMSQATAYRFMAVAERFGEKLITVISFSPKVLYELASPSTPDEVLEMVEAGQIQPTLEEIKQAKEAYLYWGDFTPTVGVIEDRASCNGLHGADTSATDIMGNLS